MRPEGDWGASGKPPVRPQAQSLPAVGLDAPTPAREKGLQPYGALYCFKGRTEGFQRASGKPFGAPAGAIPCPGGLDAPTPAREKGLQPYGALTLFFRWRKKSVQKKASGTATPEAARPAMRRGLRSAVAPSGLSSTSVRFAHPSGKKPFIAHFDGGARYVARSMVGQLTPTIVRARSSPFSAVKMGGPFSLRCLSPLCSPAVGVGHTYPLRVGMPRCSLEILRH